VDGWASLPIEQLINIILRWFSNKMKRNLQRRLLHLM